MPNASAVVASAAGGFRRCYNAALALDPRADGSVRITVKVDSAGCVVAAGATSLALDDRVVACVTDRVRQMEFDPPRDGQATVVIPVRFVSPNPPAAPAPGP